MLSVNSLCVTVFALFTCLSYASGSSCTNLCPGFFNRGKCCDDEFEFPTLSSTRSPETDGFPKTDVWTIFIGFSSLIGVIFVILIVCSCCPCCILYKHRMNGSVYRRFGRAGASSGRKKKGIFNRGVKNTKASLPPTNQTPSVTVVASHPLQVNFPQPYGPGQMMGHTVHNHLPQPQAAVQSPPPCTVTVICDSHRAQPAYNPMYRQ